MLNFCITVFARTAYLVLFVGGNQTMTSFKAAWAYKNRLSSLQVEIFASLGENFHKIELAPHPRPTGPVFNSAYQREGDGGKRRYFGQLEKNTTLFNLT